jgi:2-polyprenyl-3-methyl-5-hydroxy-6-metoxy-1,4-benzoquinol methylase
LSDRDKHAAYASPAARHDAHAEQAGMTKDAVREFFDRLAPQWDENLEVNDAKINTILDAAGIASGVRVLDVACGTGVLFPFYMSRGVAHVTAVDISPEMVRIARQKTGDSRFRILCADIEELPAAGEYDCCVVYNAFPHFPEPKHLVERLAAHLKPGGRLTIAHGMSIEALNKRHSGSASKVSRGMLTASDLAELLGTWFAVDTAVSDDEKYIVSGRRIAQEEGFTT